MGRTIKRRQFLAQCGAVPALASHLLSARSNATDAIERSLYAHIHPQVQYRRKELDPKEDGWAELARAAASLTKRSDEVDGAIPEADAPFPAGADGAILSDWLGKNQCAQKHLTAAGRYSRLQIPLSTEKTDETELLGSLMRCGRLLSVQSQRLSAGGDVDGSLASLSLLYSLGRMIIVGEGTLVYWIFGVAFLNWALTGMRRIALEITQTTQLKQLLAQLREPLDLQAAFATILRVEFCYWELPIIERLSTDGITAKLVDALLEEYTVAGVPESNLAEPNEFRRQRQGLIELLSGHPRPFDAAGTVELMSAVYAEAIEDVARPWSKRRAVFGADAAKRVAAWPAELNFLTDFFTPPPHPDKPSQNRIADARKKLRDVDNPVGNLIAANATVGGYLEPLLKTIAKHNATCLALELRINEIDAGELPEKLDQLQIPSGSSSDPFSDSNLRYDRKRKLLWSVGPDGKNSPDATDALWHSELTWTVGP